MCSYWGLHYSREGVTGVGKTHQHHERLPGAPGVRQIAAIPVITVSKVWEYRESNSKIKPVLQKLSLLFEPEQ